MSIPCKFERSILSHDEHELILRSHHPEIYDAALDDLKALRQRLRDMRNKERSSRARIAAQCAERGREEARAFLAPSDTPCSASRCSLRRSNV